MVHGLKLFRNHFEKQTDQFMLIGGAACDLIMDAAGLHFRATRDIDIVLLIEALGMDFIDSFWRFVKAGSYHKQEKSAGKMHLYRFQKPGNDAYPYEIELFSRTLDLSRSSEGSRFTPIPAESELSSLSAILLSDDYYSLIKSGGRMIEGVQVLGPEHLIPLKAKAWLDLSNRKEMGEKVDSKNIKKHKNDVFRLYQVIEPNTALSLPESVKEDLSAFLAIMQSQEIALESLGIRGIQKTDLLAELQRIYGIG